MINHTSCLILCPADSQHIFNKATIYGAAVSYSDIFRRFHKGCHSGNIRVAPARWGHAQSPESEHTDIACPTGCGVCCPS